MPANTNYRPEQLVASIRFMIGAALTTVHIPRERIGHIICARLLPDVSTAEPPGGEIAN